MRRFIGVVAAVVIMAATTGEEARAQQGTGGAGFLQGASDPFSLYYGFYLPRQQYLASQPRVTDQLNAVVEQRQYQAATRQGLFDAADPFGLESLDDPLGFGLQRNTGLVRPIARNGITATNTVTPGVPGYFNSVQRYYPTHRIGVYANVNIGGGAGGISRGRGS